MNLESSKNIKSSFLYFFIFFSAFLYFCISIYILLNQFAGFYKIFVDFFNYFPRFQDFFLVKLKSYVTFDLSWIKRIHLMKLFYPKVWKKLINVIFVRKTFLNAFLFIKILVKKFQSIDFVQENVKQIGVPIFPGKHSFNAI